MSGSQRVASGILASRVTGLLREIVIAAALGAGPVADAFRGGMKIPNLLQNLLGEGSISAAFVPVYAGLIEEDRRSEARDLARQTFGILSAVVTAVVGLIVLGARPLVWLTTLGRWSGDRYELTIELTRLTALGAGLLVLSAWCLGILNANRRYLLAYSAPVLWSLAQIIALGVAVAFDIGTTSIARWGAVAMVIGSLAQFLVQLPTVRSVDGLHRPSLTVGPDLAIVLKRFLPAVGGRGVVQISSYVDLALASLLAVGALATVTLVMPLYLLSIAVFGFSVAVSELTEMSRTRAGAAAVAARVRSAQRRVLLPAGLVTAGAVGGGAIVIGFLYESINQLVSRGDATTAFTSANTTVAAATLAAFGLGLPATMVARVSQNALYALGDVRGPARIAVARLAVAAAVGFVCMIQLDHLAVGSLDRVALAEEHATATPAELLVVAETALGGTIGDGPGSSLSVDSFPHWPPWEPLPHRESFFSDPDDGAARTGTPFVHFGAVGLGIGSAVASWTEWFLLRRRLGEQLGHPIHTGLGPWVAIAGFAAFIAARLISALGVPSLVQVIALGLAVPGVYIGSLWFMGLRPQQG